MKKYIAVVKEDNGIIEILQDFHDEYSALAHVETYGGAVAENPGGNTNFWTFDSDTNVITLDEDAATASETEKAVYKAINAIEHHDKTGMSNRKIREWAAAAGVQDAIEMEAAIKVERDKL